MPDIDGLVGVGDVIGYNPCPGAFIATLRAQNLTAVTGFHDRMLVGACIGPSRDTTRHGQASTMPK